MTVPLADARRTRFLLSADEWHVLTSRIDAIRVPVEFVSEWDDTVSPAEREHREAAALASLQQRKLVNAGVRPDEPDLTSSLHTALGTVLSLPQVATTVIDIAAWGSSRSVLQSLSVAGGFCLGLVRTQRVVAASDANIETDATGRVLDEDAVEITACATTDLVDETLRSLDLVDDRSSTRAGPVTVLSIADATAIVLAARTGNPALVQEAARRAELGDDAAGVAALAGAIAGGFSLRMHDTSTGASWAPAWLFTAEGWVRLGVDVGTGPVTAHGLAESGQVSVSTSSRAAITAEILAVVATRLGY